MNRRESRADARACARPPDRGRVPLVGGRSEHRARYPALTNRIRRCSFVIVVSQPDAVILTAVTLPRLDAGISEAASSSGEFSWLLRMVTVLLE